MLNCLLLPIKKIKVKLRRRKNLKKVKQAEKRWNDKIKGVRPMNPVTKTELN